MAKRRRKEERGGGGGERREKEVVDVELEVEEESVIARRVNETGAV